MRVYHLYRESDKVMSLLCVINALLRRPEVADKYQKMLRSAFFDIFARGNEQCAKQTGFVRTVCEFFVEPKHVPSPYFEILTILARRIIDANRTILEPDAVELIGVINGIIARIGSAFPKEFISPILCCSCGALKALNVNVLVLFWHCSSLVPAETMLQFLPMFPTAMLAKLREGTPVIENILHENVGVCLTDATPCYDTTDIGCHRTFEDRVELTNNVFIPESCGYEVLLPAELYEKAVSVAMVIGSSAVLVKDFVRMCCCFFNVETTSAHAIDLHTLVLVVLRKITDLRKCHLPLELVWSRVVFNPAITVFETGEQWGLINTMRSLAFELIVEQGTTAIENVLAKNILYPLMFAELVHRLMTIETLCFDRSQAVGIFHTLMTAMNYYYRLDGTAETKLAIGRARLSIFYFVNSIFQRAEMLSAFYEDSFLAESYITMLFETHVRGIICTSLKRYVATDSAVKNMCVNEMIMTSVKKVSKTMETKEAVNMMFDLVDIMKTATVNVPCYAGIFGSTITDICIGAVKAPKGKKSRKLVMLLLDFMTVTSTHHEVTARESSALEASIIELFVEPTQTLFTALVHLVAGRLLPTLHPTFNIRMPQALRLLVGVFMKSRMLGDTITFVAKLCQLQINCERAHNGEFDVYLIGLLNSWRDDGSIPINIVASAASLVMCIAGKISDVAVVQSFMSLFCPIDGKTYPFYYKLFVKALSSLVLSAPKRPIAAIPCTRDTYFEFSNVELDIMTEGMTVSFWVSPDDTSPAYKARLLSFENTKANICIDMYVLETSIVITIRTPKGQWTATQEMSMQRNVWSFIACSFGIEDTSKQLHVNIFCNGRERNGACFPISMLAATEMKGKVGGCAVDSADVNYPLLIGSVGIFRCLCHQEIEHLYGLGSGISTARHTSPKCFFVPHERSGSLRLENTGVDKSVIMKGRVHNYVRSMPFTDTLVSRCGVDLLLPLFAQWDLSFSDGRRFEFFPRITLDILEAALAISEDAQDVFYASSGFKLIAHIIHSSADEHITYNLYLRFVTIFNVLMSEDLRRQLFDDILLNIELWLRAGADNHRRIVWHWAHVLVQECHEIAVSMRPFQMLLSALRGYYWYDPCEQHVVITRDRCRGEPLNVGECRSSILAIACLVTTDTFTEGDFRCLISHILTCQDYRQTVDLLRLVSTLVSEDEKLFKNVGSSISMLMLLQYLINVQNEDVVCLVLQIVIDSHKKGLIGEVSLEQQIDIMLHQFTPGSITKTLLTRLIDLTETRPDLFPICSWIAMNIGEKGIREMISKLRPNQEFSGSEFWAIYSVVAMYNGNDKLRTFISRFLIQCCPISVAALFAAVDIVGQALGRDADPLKRTILLEYGKMIQGGVEELSAPLYLTIVHQFLLFQRGLRSSPAVAAMYKGSDYTGKPAVSKKRKTPRRRGGNSPLAQRREARRSLHPSSMLCEQPDEGLYSPLLAQRALACLNLPKLVQRGRREFQARRTSMLTVGRCSIDYDDIASPDVFPEALMPYSLDDMIAEIDSSEFSYHYGLRLDKEGQWEDVTLAEQAIKVCTGVRDTENTEKLLVISAFLVRFSAQVTCQFLDVVGGLQFEHLRGACLFLDRRLMLANISRKTTVPVGQVEKAAVAYTERLCQASSGVGAEPLQFMNRLTLFQSANSAKAFDIFAMISNETIGASSNVIADYSDFIMQSRGARKRLWRQYWRCMTIDRAPWRRSIPSATLGEVHYKRDSTICANMCPVKVKRNDKFTNHMDAVFLRDSSDAKSAQQMMEQYEEELASQYTMDAPAQLLEVVVDRVEDASANGRTAGVCSCIIELPCEWITISQVKTATFALFHNAVVIMLESGKITHIPSDEISKVLLRTRFHLPTAIEIFQTNGKTYFINFLDVNANTVLKSFRGVSMPAIQLMQLKDFKRTFAGTKFVERWVSGGLSNFEYIMQLNIISGRTFNCASQYPVFPWILSDYVSENLDLTDPSVFRDLSLPVGALEPARFLKLQERQKDNDLSYVYASGYVNPLNVYLWLVRLEPFTTLHIDFQSGRFDRAARLFKSLQDAWELTFACNDYREMIPELFFLPEMLENRDRFNLGTFDGKPVDDVDLPRWASTALEFVYLHRKALESEHVSANLNKWIDLIWGEKQRASDNLFPPEMYDDVWDNITIEDAADRARVETVMSHVGQIPPQLFDKAHPTRSSRSVVPLINSVVTIDLDMPSLVVSNINISEETVVIRAFKSCGNYAIVKFDAARIRMHSHIPSKMAKGRTMNAKGFDRIGATSDIITAFTSESFLVSGADRTELFLVKLSSGASTCMQRQRAEIVGISCDGNWIALANRDAEMLLFKGGDLNRPIFRIPSFTSSIACSALSDPFQTVVLGTRDGSLMFCSLNTGSVNRVVSIDNRRASSIIITPSWGFVAVETTELIDGDIHCAISLYTINGDLIRTAHLSHRISCWSAFRTTSGFDFISLVDVHGNCHVFEAFYVTIGNAFHVSKYRVIDIAYMVNESLSILTTDNGKVIFVPAMIGH